MEPLAAFVGTMIDFMIGTLIWGLLVVDLKTDAQFKKDCVAMAHGTVDKSAGNICVRNGKILFHK